MLARLVLLFTIVPIIELALILWVNTLIGPWPTFGIILVTGFTGALMGKLQGLKAWRKIKEELARGELPQDSILDGLAVLIASALLLTPGVLTDLAGFILLFPPTRAPIRAFAKRRLTKWLQGDMPSPGHVIFSMSGGVGGFGGFDGFDGADDLRADDLGGFGASRGHVEGAVLDITPEGRHANKHDR
jgi:UPF0716 protein FxsA